MANSHMPTQLLSHAPLLHQIVGENWLENLMGQDKDGDCFPVTVTGNTDLTLEN